MKTYKAVLGQPGYGKPTAASSRGFWRASQHGQIWYHYQQGSLLASNFNQLWCMALNLVHHGERVDYFAMLHDDVAPEDGWLDNLIDELETKQLDVLSVAIPIKDSRGITSMALAKHDDDGWLPHCRLSMHDVYELPETFTSDDLDGYKLLLNTGCWVAKWNQDWCRTVHFEINDRIVFNRSANRYQSQTEPEDWHFSRQLHEIGRGPTSHLKPLRIGATRKIAVKHTGDVDFENNHAWGRNRFDVEAAEVSPVPGAFPGEIPGWLTPAEGKLLAELATDKNVLEIGSYCGLSTVCIGRTANHVTALDYFDGRETPAPQNTLPQFTANITRYGLADKVIAVRPGQCLPKDKYDIVFIDGDHSEEAVERDVQLALSVLADDGLIVFHDYRHPSHPGIATVVAGLLREGGKLLETIDTLAVVRPPAAELLEV